MSSDEFFAMNPAFKPDSPPSPPYNLLLPLKKAEALVASFRTHGSLQKKKPATKRKDAVFVTTNAKPFLTTSDLALGASGIVAVQYAGIRKKGGSGLELMYKMRYFLFHGQTTQN